MLAEWQASAILDLRETDLSYQEIANKYGRDRDTIIKLKKASGVVRKMGPRKGSRPATAAKQLSPAHRSLGVRLSLYRGMRTYNEIAQELNVSGYVVRRMEYGLHDFTLTQLQRLSTVMGQSIETLLAPYRVKS